MCLIKDQIENYNRYSIKMLDKKIGLQARAELGQAQIKLELGFTLMKI